MRKSEIPHLMRNFRFIYFEYQKHYAANAANCPTL